MMDQTARNGKPHGVFRAVIPLWMHLYCRALAFAQGISLRALHADCALRFLEARPWEQGLSWRFSPSAGEGKDWEWTDEAVTLPRDLGRRLEHLSVQRTISTASVLYTMLFWYSWVVFPPLHEQLRRKEIEDSRPCQNSSR
jgi:hypothetical protein